MSGVSIVPPNSTRLRFEPLRAEHAAGLFGPLCDPRVYEHLGERPPATIAALAERFALMASGPPPYRAEEQWINYVVRLQADGALIGRVEATLIARQAEVAYLFGADYWGRGLAFEAMTALQYRLSQSLGVREFWATTSPANLRSIRLLNRLGYQQAPDTWPSLGSYDPGDLVFALHRGDAASDRDASLST